MDLSLSYTSLDVLHPRTCFSLEGFIARIRLDFAYVLPCLDGGSSRWIVIVVSSFRTWLFAAYVASVVVLE